MNPARPFRGKVQRSAGELHAATPTSPFDGPLGVGDDCLSARRIVRLLQIGASADDLQHLKTCPICRTTLARLEGQQMRSSPDFIRRAMSLAGGATPPPTEKVEMSPLVGVVLGAEDSVVTVPEPTSKDMTLSLDVFPAFKASLLRDIDQGSLSIEGAFASDNGTIEDVVDLDDDQRPDFLRVSFASGRLASRVRKAIQGNQRIIDSVVVRGHFKSSHANFVGQAQLEFRPVETGEAESAR